MAYADFTLGDLRTKMGVDNQRRQLFEAIMPVNPSEWLSNTLENNRILPLRTEKARSELLVSPILQELYRRNSDFLTIYSGEVLSADPTNGLTGECDFFIAKDTGSYDITYPILHIVEAKKNDIDTGIPQCAAQMLGAYLFNKNKGTTVGRIHGCVTTGEEWRFMYLENKIIYIDKINYYLSDLPDVLGVFQHIIDYYRKNM